jgi:hypothetical protein
VKKDSTIEIKTAKKCKQHSRRNSTQRRERILCRKIESDVEKDKGTGVTKKGTNILQAFEADIIRKERYQLEIALLELLKTVVLQWYS